MKYLKLLIPTVALLIFLAACQSNPMDGITGSSSEKAYSEKPSATGGTYSNDNLIHGYTYNDKTKKKGTSSFTTGSGNTPIPKKTSLKIIKTGDIKVQCKNVDEAYKLLTQLTEKHNGIISNESLEKNQYSHQNVVTIKIPYNHFDGLVTDITDQYKNIDKKQISSKDVTEEYVDLQARLKSKKILEERYISFLAKAKNIEEILKVEAQVNLVRTEIERIEGRLNYLSEKVSYSTLSVTLYEKLSYTPSVAMNTNWGKKFANGFKNGWKGIMSFLLAMITIWPLWVFIIGIVMLIKFKVFQRMFRWLF